MANEPKISKILWPNDLSKCSEGALPHVLSIAKQHGARVHVLYVTEDLAHHEPWYGDFDSTHFERVMEWQLKRARDYQAKFCKRHLEGYAAYETHIEVGNPVHKILEFIEARAIDMVVMCRRGKTGDFKIGSVSQKVVANAPVPVVITPGPQNEA